MQGCKLSNPSYSLDNSTFIAFPGYYRIPSKPKGREEANITHTTVNGVDFVYNMWQKEVKEFVFNVLDADLHEFDEFHQAVNGEQFPFYISESGAGASDSILVRKEPGFDPRELERTQRGILWEYVLKVKTALT